MHFNICHLHLCIDTVKSENKPPLPPRIKAPNLSAKPFPMTCIPEYKFLGFHLVKTLKERYSVQLQDPGERALYFSSYEYAQRSRPATLI